MKGLEDFEREFPSRDQFFNYLTEEEVNEEPYLHAQKVCSSFGCKSMGDWHDLYVKFDTTLLADIMRELREILYEKYELDLYQYLSLAMLSFDCMLKFTGVKLEYIKDPEMHNSQFAEVIVGREVSEKLQPTTNTWVNFMTHLYRRLTSCMWMQIIYVRIL